MGQRSQIIVSLPKYYLNKDNPNNRPKSYLIYHNQWLYGYNFLKHIRDIIEMFNKIVNHWMEEMPFTPDYLTMFDQAVSCANYTDPTNIQKTRRYFSDSNMHDNKYFVGKSIDDVMDELDNNNGYIFFKIDEKGDISYDVVNGYEDAPVRMRRTPHDYLYLFYPIGSKPYRVHGKEFTKLLEELNNLKMFNYKDLNEVKKYMVIEPEQFFLTIRGETKCKKMKS